MCFFCHRGFKSRTLVGVGRVDYDLDDDADDIVGCVSAHILHAPVTIDVHAPCLLAANFGESHATFLLRRAAGDGKAPSQPRGGRPVGGVWTEGAAADLLVSEVCWWWWRRDGDNGDGG